MRFNRYNKINYVFRYDFFEHRIFLNINLNQIFGKKNGVIKKKWILTIDVGPNWINTSLVCQAESSRRKQ